MKDDAPQQKSSRHVITRVSCPSTQDIIREEALLGAPAGTVAITDHQTQGRGRRGRTWSAPAGKALMFSYLARPRRPLAELGTLSLVIGIVLCENLPIASHVRWPNDLVADGGKVAGVLVELITPREGDPFAIVGIGINANITREELPETDRLPATSLLLISGCEIDRGALFEQVVNALDTALALFDLEGFAAFRSRYELVDGLRGHLLVLRLPDRDIIGTAEGVDVTGRLILRLPDGVSETFAAGEVERVIDP